MIDLLQNVMTHTSVTIVLKPVHVSSAIQNHVTRSMVLVRAMEAGKVLTVRTMSMSVRPSPTHATTRSKHALIPRDHFSAVV